VARACTLTTRHPEGPCSGGVVGACCGDVRDDSYFDVQLGLAEGHVEINCGMLLLACWLTYTLMHSLPERYLTALMAGFLTATCQTTVPRPRRLFPA